MATEAASRRSLCGTVAETTAPRCRFRRLQRSGVPWARRELRDTAGSCCPSQWTFLWGPGALTRPCRSAVFRTWRSCACPTAPSIRPAGPARQPQRTPSTCRTRCTRATRWSVRSSASEGGSTCASALLCTTARRTMRGSRRPCKLALQTLPESLDCVLGAAQGLPVPLPPQDNAHPRTQALTAHALAITSLQRSQRESVACLRAAAASEPPASHALRLPLAAWRVRRMLASPATQEDAAAAAVAAPSAAMKCDT
mmetsp:Transcript_3743/g.15569  ORF Transcript_3743/g.15569 Transcript_3743/m.15569 type:complete len:255 (-) Transcript_3743:594-1358(-)